MQIITVIASQMSADALNAALPTEGVVAVNVTEIQTFSRTPVTVESYRGRKIAQHFTSGYRIEIAAEDAAAQAVVEGIAFARSAGLLGDARAWVSQDSAADVFAPPGRRALGLSANA